MIQSTRMGLLTPFDQGRFLTCQEWVHILTYMVDVKVYYAKSTIVNENID